MNKHIKDFLKASLFFLVFNTTIMATSFAQDRVGGGDGGSAAEGRLVAEKRKFIRTMSDIFNFFEQNPDTATVWSESIRSQTLDLRGQIRVEIVNTLEADRVGQDDRGCISYRDQEPMLIRCLYSHLQRYSNPREYYILVAHELFALNGIETSSIVGASLEEKYPESYKIAQYVTRFVEFRLQFAQAQDHIWHQREIQIEDRENARYIYPSTCAVTTLLNSLYAIPGELNRSQRQRLEDLKELIMRKGYILHNDIYSSENFDNIGVSDENLFEGLWLFLGYMFSQTERRHYLASRVSQESRGDNARRVFHNVTTSHFGYEVVAFPRIMRRRERTKFLNSIEEAIERLPYCMTGLGIYR